MADRNLLLAQRLAPDDLRAQFGNAPFAPDVQPDGSPDPNATGGWNIAAEWRRVQRQKSVEMGLLDPETGLPTRKGAMDAAQQFAGAFEGGIKGYHGSPHSFDKFQMDKIGTGEGAQAYGHGLYFAEREGVAKGYRDALSAADGVTPEIAEAYRAHATPNGHLYIGRGNDAQMYSDPKWVIRDALKYPEIMAQLPPKLAEAMRTYKTPGHMYEVNINADPEHFLHWDKSLSEQHPKVQAAIGQLSDNSAALNEQLAKANQGVIPPLTGRDLMSALGTDSAKTATKLQSAGIPGVRYLDQGSRTGGEGTHNIVVFDPETIEILRKYGIAGLGLGGAAAATAGADQGQDQAP